MQTSVDGLAKLPPAFEKDGQVTAGNAPGLNDGGAALVLTHRAEAERQGTAPLARIVGYTHFAAGAEMALCRARSRRAPPAGQNRLDAWPMWTCSS